MQETSYKSMNSKNCINIYFFYQNFCERIFKVSYLGSASLGQYPWLSDEPCVATSGERVSHDSFSQALSIHEYDVQKCHPFFFL